MDDFETVLEAAQGGDRRAAGLLFEAYQPMLLRYLRSQERRVADDLGGEVWLAVAAGLQRFRGDEAGFRAWLFTIARRRVIDHRRIGVRQRTDVVDPYTFCDAGSDDDTAQSVVDSIEAQVAVSMITEVLSADQAEVLILRVVADLRAAEVGLVMDRSETWVRVTQHRAIKRLNARFGARLDATR